MRATRASWSGPRAKKRRPSAEGGAWRETSRRLQRLLAAGRPAVAPGPREPVKAAAAARLRYVNDDQPGLSRRASGGGFSYRRADGRPVRDRATLDRIARLAIPPAWTEVWICPHPDGHIQATGRDARRRKQYRYHPRWREVRDRTKFGHMVEFARALPRIRRQVAADVRRPGLPREKVLATVVRLLESTSIRVGGDEYARDNGSFGLTTLRDQHVNVRGPELRFRFRGKGGKAHAIGLRDRALARIVRNCQEIPGQRLFQYVDPAGRRRAVGSGDVNDYLRALGGSDFTAKDFRTWTGTTVVAGCLATCAQPPSAAAANREVLAAIDAAAQRLGNTRAVCRSSYVHPAVVDAFVEGRMMEGWRGAPGRGARRPGRPRGLAPLEVATLRLLQAAARPRQRRARA